MNFSDFNLSASLTESIKRMGFKEPTPIQTAAIPLALEGKDILGSAQTGTGKTAAFSIPVIEYLLNNKKSRALILTPTRELAKQVLDNIKELLGNGALPIKTAFIIGGDSMGKQLQQLKANPQIIVGTPGRVNDHLERKSLDLSKAGFLVLDETDRMLDMGFGVQLDRIIPHMRDHRQTLLFSATLPKQILKLADKYQNNPERVSMGATNVIAPTIKQDVRHLDAAKKYDALVEEIGNRDGSIIVFSKTKYGAEKMAKRLAGEGFKADTLHGGLRQNKRNTVMRKFREQKFRVLVATDVAARGLDVPHIEHVINYDLPQAAEDYIHRMGRTGRNGAEGSAVSFVCRADNGKWKEIQRFLDPNFKGETSNDNYKSTRHKNRRNSRGDTKGNKWQGRPNDRKRSEGRYGENRSKFDPRSEARSDNRPESRNDKKHSVAKKSFHDNNSEQTPSFKKKYKPKTAQDKFSGPKKTYQKAYQKPGAEQPLKSRRQKPKVTKTFSKTFVKPK